jgi:LDH2 family malate/lactate/ureidoglycolate dehydrogenase
LKHYFFNDTVNIPFTTLHNWTTDIFRAVGMRDTDAGLVAETLAVADARGVFSHGCLRVPLYVKRIETKSVDPIATPVVARERGAMALIDGQNAAGQVVSYLAMNKAIELADTHGVSFVTANNSNHNGAAAYYSMMALPQNMVGFSSSIGGGNLMPMHGGAERKVGNNPFSIAFPALRHQSLVLDMAQSIVAKGKIVMAQKTGSTIPEQWALDSNGLPTTDPSAAINGFLRTMGDYKGTGLSIAIGMLSTMLSGAAMGPTLKDVYEDFEPLNIGHSFCAIRLDFLIDPEEFRKSIDLQIDFIKHGKMAPNINEVFFPGEMEARTYQQQMENGIDMPAEVISTLIELSQRFGVNIPLDPLDKRSLT